MNVTYPIVCVLSQCLSSFCTQLYVGDSNMESEVIHFLFALEFLDVAFSVRRHDSDLHMCAHTHAHTHANTTPDIICYYKIKDIFNYKVIQFAFANNTIKYEYNMFSTRQFLLHISSVLVVVGSLLFTCARHLCIMLWCRTVTMMKPQI